MVKRNLIALGAGMMLMAGCVTSQTGFDTQSALGKTPAVSDTAWRQVCRQYAGPRREFWPDKSQGLRTYDSVCGRLCAQALADGYDFVDVIWLDYVWDESSLQTSPKRIERYRKAASFDESCLTDQISVARYRKCFQSGKVLVTQAATEAVQASTMTGQAFADEARLIWIEANHSGARITGGFRGARDISTGALSGYGEFHLEGPANSEGQRQVLASCPNPQTQKIGTCANAHTCQLPQPAP